MDVVERMQYNEIKTTEAKSHLSVLHDSVTFLYNTLHYVISYFFTKNRYKYRESACLPVQLVHSKWREKSTNFHLSSQFLESNFLIEQILVEL